jgi:PAS domain S-box-containing protein
MNIGDKQIKYIVTLLLVGVSYFIAGKIGLQFAFVNTNTTAIWAPTGIALASYLLFGRKVWPAIFVAAFFTNLTTAGSFGTSVGIALGNTLEGLIGAYLVNRFAHGKNTLHKGEDLVSFTIFGGLLSTTISANIGVITLIVGGLATWQQFFQIWFTWWMGDVAGALIVAPFILFWSVKRPLYSSIHNKMEAIIAFLVLILISLLVFGGVIKGFPLFLSIPVLVWIAFRFGRRESITAILVLAGFAIYGTLQGYGAFIKDNVNDSLLLLQTFMDVMTLTVLSLSIAIADRREAQRMILGKEERFRALIEKSSEAVSLTDSKGNIIYVSPSFTHILGYAPEEVLGKSGLILIHPDDVNHAIKVTTQIVDKPGKSITVVIRCFHKNGSIRYVQVISTNLLDNPNVGAVVSNFHDVTELKQKEAEIAHEKVEDEALLASIGDGIIATDPEGKIILANTACEEMLGWNKNEMLGRNELEFISMFDEKGNQIEGKDHPLKVALARKRRVTTTYYIIRKDGTKFPARITAAPVLQSNKTTGVIKVFHDITREKEIDEMKNEFISLASHELRTPLSAIRGFMSMINEGDYGPIGPKLKRPLSIIGVSTERLINIVNEMLDVSRIESGKLLFNFSDVSISAISSDVIEHLHPLAEKKDVKLVFKKGNELSVQADKEKLIEMLNNLIGNALKFTDKGSVTISTEKKGELGIVYIIDTGVGIAKEDQKKLFGKFDEIKLKQAGKTTGTGLGLYISHEYAQKMGGDVWVESSTEGKGSTFAFSLPLAASRLAKKIKLKIEVKER